MEQQDVTYDKAEYIETASGNKVSRSCVLCGSQNIVLNGKTIVQSGCIIRGDLANINVGRQCLISKGTVITPPFRKLPHGRKFPELIGHLKFCVDYHPWGAFYPMHMGDNIIVGENSIINAQSIGSYVHIGKNCIISRSCVLKDCCRVEDNTVLAPDTVVPPFTIFSGSPGTMSGELPETTQEIMIDATRNFYKHFIAVKTTKS